MFDRHEEQGQHDPRQAHLSPCKSIAPIIARKLPAKSNQSTEQS